MVASALAVQSSGAAIAIKRRGNARLSPRVTCQTVPLENNRQQDTGQSHPLGISPGQQDHG
jgi:hypothetical protein